MTDPNTPTGAAGAKTTNAWRYVAIHMTAMIIGIVGGPLAFDYNLNKREDRIVSDIENQYGVEVAANPRALELDSPGSWTINGARYTCILPYEPRAALACKQGDSWIDYASLPGATQVSAEKRPAPGTGTQPAAEPPGEVTPEADAPADGDDAVVVPWDAYTFGQ